MSDDGGNSYNHWRQACCHRTLTPLSQDALFCHEKMQGRHCQDHPTKHPSQISMEMSVSAIVTRTKALTFFFATSNLIESHNHAQQHLLGLECRWKTPNPWLCANSTAIGMTAMDCWKALCHWLPQVHGKMTVEECANRLAFDCVNNEFQKTTEQRRPKSTLRQMGLPWIQVSQPGCQDLSMASSLVASKT